MLRGFDVGSHGYRHHTYHFAKDNLANVRRGIGVLRQAGLEPSGYAAPHGRFNRGLLAGLEELGVTHSSEFALAYDELPLHLKQRLEGRIGTFKYGGLKKLNQLLNEEDRDARPVRHRLIQVHPETGRKLLYFDQGKILTIEGLEAAESAATIEEMRAYFVQPPCQYRHQWRKGDIVIWDNRCSYHKAAGDYPPEEDRIHWRVSIKSR